eukprot:scaffold33779_cov50-Prasinocladus_malaysianus.AAC.3
MLKCSQSLRSKDGMGWDARLAHLALVDPALPVSEELRQVGEGPPGEVNAALAAKVGHAAQEALHSLDTQSPSRHSRHRALSALISLTKHHDRYCCGYTKRIIKLILT